MARQKTTIREKMRRTAAEAMLEAAERAMIRKGYSKATMAQIAAEAGCAPGTFYLYFKNKEELFQAITARHGQALFELARDGLNAPGEPMEKIRRSVERHLRYIWDHKPFFRLFFTAIPMRQRTFHSKLSPHIRQKHESYNLEELEVLRQAQKKGQIRRDLSAEVLQHYMEAVGISFVEKFLFSEAHESVAEQTEIIWGLVVGGLVARSGHGRS